jgi:hypothetical protein
LSRGCGGLGQRGGHAGVQRQESPLDHEKGAAAPRTTATFDDVWSAAGPTVGVVVGAVPAAVFGTRSQETARKASVRAETYAARLTPEKAAEAESAAKEQLG